MFDIFELNNTENHPYGLAAIPLGEPTNINQINSYFSSETLPPASHNINSLEINPSSSLPEAANDRFDPLTGVGGDSSLSFIENLGQLDRNVDFYLRGSTHQVYFGEDNITFNASGEIDGEILLERVELDFANSNQNQKITPLDKLPGVANFLYGKDASQWHQNVPTYGGIVYEELYSGIDLIYSGNGGNIKSDFIVEPGMEPSQIIMEYAGIEDISVNESGELVLKINLGELKEEKPVIYQVIDNRRIEIAGGYQLLGNNRVGFAIGKYDRDFPLVIDPTLESSLLFGGSGGEEGNAIALDNTGNIYMTGNTSSVNFPTFNAVQNNLTELDDEADDSVSIDAFVTKIAPDGTIIYSTYLGGSDFDTGADIAADNQGNVYVIGTTESSDFPNINAFQTEFQGKDDSEFIEGGDAFLTKLSSDGSSIIYSTFLGSSDRDLAEGIAIDNQGHAYVTGTTEGDDFPAAGNTFQADLTDESRKVFVTKFSTDGRDVIYSTFLGGGTSGDIAVDNDGNAYITGGTRDEDFPILNAVQSELGGSGDIFVTKLNSNGDNLIYSTYFGNGENDDFGSSIFLSDSGNVYIAGSSSPFQIIFPDPACAFAGTCPFPPPIVQASDFPTFNAFQSEYGGGLSDGVVVKLNRDGGLEYSTLLGGSNRDFARSIAVDALGNAYVTGETVSTDFPTQNPFQDSLAGSNDAFVAKIAPDGSFLEYSSYLGGSRRDSGSDIALDIAGNLYIIGSTSSEDFPTVNPDNTILLGDRDPFLVKIAPDTTPPQSSFQDFVAYIVERGINPLEIYYDEEFYLANNPDVVRVISNGLYRNGFDHLIRTGLFQGRDPSPLYNETIYLTENPDVAAPIARGEVRSGFEHFLNFGFYEGRDRRAAEFDEEFYLAANPGVAEAVENGIFSTGFEHFIVKGKSEGRQGRSV